MIKLGNVFILGDSYSTFKNCIPEGFATYYSSERENCDVEKKEDTWWGIVLNSTDSFLVLNSSWSGTTICNTGYDKADYSDKSFIARFDKLIADGFFEQNKIDTLLLFGGTNDCWAYSPIGEKVTHGWTKEQLYSFKPAFCYLIDEIRKTLPDTKLLNIINTEFLPEFDNAIKTLSKELNVDTLTLKDIDKTAGHPTKKGMEQIAEQVLIHLENK